MKNKKILVIGGFIVVALGVLALLNYRKKVNNEKLIKLEVDSPDVEKSTNEIEKEIKTSIDKNKILKSGVKSDEVKVLQKALKKLTVDGDFGEATRKKLAEVFLLNQITLNQYNDFLPKSSYVVLIHNRGRKVDIEKLYSFDLDFIKAWSYAIVNNKPFFKYQLFNYDSLSGNKTNQKDLLNPLNL